MEINQQPVLPILLLSLSVFLSADAIWAGVVLQKNL